MSQKDEAMRLIGDLCGDACNERKLRELRDVLGAAQNGPPDGTSDGSINEEFWYKLRAIAGGFIVVQREVKDLSAAAGS